MAQMSLDEAASVHHEMYLSWVRAGFSEEQAFVLLLHWMEAVARND